MGKKKFNIIKFQDYLNAKLDSNKIISIFCIGSMVNNKYNNLSDIDIVIIGNEKIRIDDLIYLKKLFKEYFQVSFKSKSIFFSEPAFERIFYLFKEPPDYPIVHLIYHPIDRFNKYLDSNDFIIYNWKTNYVHLFGADILYNTKFDIKKYDNSFISFEIDEILQQVQNLYLTNNIIDDYYYFLKTFLFCISKLNSVYKLMSDKNLNPSILLDKKKFYLDNLSANKLDMLLHNLENSLFILKNDLLKIEK